MSSTILLITRLGSSWLSIPTSLFCRGFMFYICYLLKYTGIQMIFVLFNSNTTYTNSIEGTVYNSGPEITPRFECSSCSSILSFLCSVLSTCFVILYFAFMKCVLRFTADSEYPVGLSKFSWVFDTKRLFFVRLKPFVYHSPPPHQIIFIYFI